MKCFSALVLFLFLFVGITIFVKPIFASPSITINSFNTPVVIGQSFNISATASGLVASSAYYIKFRLGDSLSELNKGQTFNSVNDAPDDWLSDGDSWSKFPQYTVNSDGNASISLTARPGGSTLTGGNFIEIRMRKTDGSTNYDSSSVSVAVNPAPTPTPSPVSTNTPTPTPAPTSTPTKTPTPTRLLAQASTPTPTKTPTPTPEVLSETTESADPVAEVQSVATISSTGALPVKIILIPLVSIGLGLGILSGVFVWQKRNAIRPQNQ